MQEVRWGQSSTLIHRQTLRRPKNARPGFDFARCSVFPPDASDGHTRRYWEQAFAHDNQRQGGNLPTVTHKIVLRMHALINLGTQEVGATLMTGDV
jgi:hypothetical protein